MIKQKDKSQYKDYSREQLVLLVEAIEEELITQGWIHITRLVLFMGGGVVLGWVGHKFLGG